MERRRSRTCGIALLVLAASTLAYGEQATGSYQAVKACSLLSLAEMKKLAPWPANLDQQAKAEELALPQRSLCVYPTAQVQVEAYRSQIIESARKTAPLDPVPGVGDDAYIRNNQNLFAVIYAKVGPHLLTVEMEIPVGKTFDSAKPTAIEIAKAFAAKLR
jgi:hypothetical protein